MRLLFVLLLTASCHRASAQAIDPPSKMTVEKAIRLDRDLAHIRELSAAMEPYQRDAAEICAENKIDPAQLGKTVGVNFMTGEIQRAKAQK